MNALSSPDWPVQIFKGAPDAEVLHSIRALANAAEEADGNPPLSEQTWVNLKAADTDQLIVLATYANEEKSDPATATALAGVAVVNLPVHGEDAGVLELVVHPEYRNQGVGTGLVTGLQQHTELPALRAWSHGDHEGAAKLAGRFGFTPVRELWRMRLTHVPQLPEAALPEGVSIRAFVPGRDEQAWLAANAAAFAHHPEQGQQTLADLQARMAEPWFDPAGFLLAVDKNDGGLLGFHWTKIHPRTGSHPSIGEVYVVGVTPQAQGSGLGKALTIAGIKHLHDQGQQAVMLYVDADNTAAVALYRKLGFTRWDTDVMYAPAEATAASR
ncbi:acetyltransferase, GNAT family protein [Arthrobacter crystallopoietes BAB-32]|uniref:Mycothiol acetyltransferase n=1 Tax=Arthrobacter crystallopoietes BAB-32 TaxID=1246476 RepID=N1V0W3_9MICC|nr:mycothiol synthase [Arthrobacter crystallopoietes]EMY33669.1 acetyltransferase, GNAT family protein [Arthrobacter crystallopoietes BAB-32]